VRVIRKPGMLSIFDDAHQVPPLWMVSRPIEVAFFHTIATARCARAVIAGLALSDHEVNKEN